MPDEVAISLHGNDRDGDRVHICSESVVKCSENIFFRVFIKSGLYQEDIFHRPCEQEYIDKNTGC